MQLGVSARPALHHPPYEDAYKRAFFCRRQSSRLHVGPDANRTGANGIFSKPDAAAAASSKVDVHVLSVLNGLDLVYFVTVNDRPVLAAAAVRDMSLVTTREAANHLGRAVKTKARRE